MILVGGSSLAAHERVRSGEERGGGRGVKERRGGDSHTVPRSLHAQVECPVEH